MLLAYLPGLPIAVKTDSVFWRLLSDVHYAQLLSIVALVQGRKIQHIYGALVNQEQD